MTELRRLAEGVHVFLQPPLVWYSSAGVVVGDRDVIVVDSLTNAAMTRSFLEEIRRVTDLPVRFLVNTHAHADHVYTNHLFPDALAIASHRGLAETRANRGVQERHDALFSRLFPDVDFEGGRYTPQDLGFSGSLTLHQGEREVRLIELGAGHSESDVVVHLPAERIVFCGDAFLDGVPPLPGEGRVSQTIANLAAIEALEADVYVAGHGGPGTLADVRAQRLLLESQFRFARGCFEQEMSFDAAFASFAGSGVPLDFRRLVLFSSYWELGGRRPETDDPACQNHLTLLQAVAAEVRLLRRRRGAPAAHGVKPPAPGTGDGPPLTCDD